MSRGPKRLFPDYTLVGGFGIRRVRRKEPQEYEDLYFGNQRLQTINLGYLDGINPPRNPRLIPEAPLEVSELQFRMGVSENTGSLIQDPK